MPSIWDRIRTIQYWCQLLFLAHLLLLRPNVVVVSALTLTMGLLKVGVPQPWEKSKKNLNYVREAGVRQFISTYNRVKDLKADELLWGDEIEYGIFVLDEQNKKVRLSLRAKEVRCFSLMNIVCVHIMSFLVSSSFNQFCMLVLTSFTKKPI
jgi:hypothetical protein